MQSDQTKLLAFALYEIRVMLAGYLGSQDAPLDVRLAAHLAYALHNEADAVMNERTFDVEASLSRIAGIDRILDVTYGSELANRFAAKE